MPFSHWRRRLLRAVTGITLYFTLWLAELTVITFVFRRPVQVAYYFPDAPPLLNAVVYLLIPATPLAVIGWFYKGRRRDFALIVAAALFAVLLWIPWLGTVSTPIPVDVLTRKAMERGGEVCGVYRAETVEHVFVYEETLTSPKKCYFFFLRPEPRFNYVLVLNTTTRVKFLNGSKSNMYGFSEGGFFVKEFYLGASARDAKTIFGDYVREDSVFVTAAGRNRVADDWFKWFVFSPEPGGAKVRLVIKFWVKAEPFVPWSQ